MGSYRLDGGLERVRRREVGLDAGVDAEAEGIVGLADLPLHAAARHRRCCCFSLVPLLLLVSFFAGKKGLGLAPLSLGLIYIALASNYSNPCWAGPTITSVRFGASVIRFQLESKFNFYIKLYRNGKVVEVFISPIRSEQR